MKNFVVSSMGQARKYFKRNNCTHALSVTLPFRKPYLEDLLPNENWRHMTCEDTESPHDHMAPTLEQMQYHLSWIKKLPEFSTVLIHCEAGISRSTAVTFAALVQEHGLDNLEFCKNELLRIRPEAAPNRLMVAYADQILGANGAMSEVAQKINERFFLKKFGVTAFSKSSLVNYDATALIRNKT